MKRHTLISAAGVALAAALSGALALPAQAGTAHQAASGPLAGGGTAKYALTTKTPYQPLGTARSYQRPPVGFTPVFTENVSRHGSRTLTSSTEGDNLVALWNIARAQGGLTALGKTLGPEVQQLLAANAAVGYGDLTASGKQEIAATAVRMEDRLPGLFKAAASSKTPGARIDVVAASQQRTVDSASAFVSGLESVNPKLAPVIGPVRTDDSLLYFHKSNTAYQDYLKNDPRLAAAEAAATDQPKTHAIATEMLRRSFTPAFVKQIVAGTYSAEFANEIDAAQAVYDLWAVTADMPDEGSWHMNKYISPSEAAWYGYLDDVVSFYENGPAFSGDTVTYSMAGVLLNDMFAKLDGIRNGSSDLVAELRFTHAEEIFPLATLLGLPGSTRQLPAGTEFSYADDQFRGTSVAPMAANVQWDLFRKGNTYLVRMLYNEKQTAFKSSCAPVSKGSYFYDLSTLESCYGYTPAAS